MKERSLQKVSFDETGNKIAFLHSPDKDSTATQCTLYLSENNAPARQIADREQSFIPAGWVISENGDLRFSENAQRLFFGTAPAPQQKDTTVLADNRPDVQIWKWDEAVQYTQQVFNKEKDLKKSYAAVYNIPENKLIQLADQRNTDSSDCCGRQRIHSIVIDQSALRNRTDVGRQKPLRYLYSQPRNR